MANSELISPVEACQPLRAGRSQAADTEAAGFDNLVCLMDSQRQRRHRVDDGLGCACLGTPNTAANARAVSSSEKWTRRMVCGSPGPLRSSREVVATSGTCPGVHVIELVPYAALRPRHLHHERQLAKLLAAVDVAAVTRHRRTPPVRRSEHGRSPVTACVPQGYRLSEAGAIGRASDRNERSVVGVTR
jgi:hypothetical protein